MSFFRTLFALAALLFAGCSSPSLYLTVHSPKGTQYLGKMNKTQSTQVQNWLLPKGEASTLELRYKGEDARAIYILAATGASSEVLEFEKDFVGPEFTLSGMEITSEWR
jgi:hypothetical protein